MHSHAAVRCGTAQNDWEKKMLQNLFKRNRHEPEIDETLVQSTQRLMGRMENLLDDMEAHEHLRNIRFATIDSPPSYYR